MDNKLLAHVTKWKSVYELFWVIVALFFSFLAVMESRQPTEISSMALKLTRDSLNLQSSEFELRNRFYLLLSHSTFWKEEVEDDGKIYPYSILIKLSNLSEIPANKVNAICRSFTYGKEIQKDNLASHKRWKAIKMVQTFRDRIIRAYNNLFHQIPKTGLYLVAWSF